MTQIVTLNLSFCLLSSRSLSFLAEVFSRQMVHFETLHLSGNDFGSGDGQEVRDVDAALTTIFVKLVNLKELHLDFCHLEDKFKHYLNERSHFLTSVSRKPFHA